MSNIKLPEAIEKALIAYRESNYQTVDDNGKRVRRAIAAELCRVKMREHEEACATPHLCGAMDEWRSELAALEAGE